MDNSYISSSDAYSNVNVSHSGDGKIYMAATPPSEEIIYSGYATGDYVTCNGIYPGPSWERKTHEATFFSTNLGTSLNRNHFRISFYFWVEAYSENCLLMLSSDYRVFGISLDNGKIYINSQDRCYKTGETYRLSAWNYFSVEYNYGTCHVNGNYSFAMDMNTTEGNNILSSINYSNGSAFKGYLSNISVTNLQIE
jgi:hypothetical protein